MAFHARWPSLSSPLEAGRIRLSGSGIRIFLVIWDPDLLDDDPDLEKEPDPNEDPDLFLDLVS